MVNRQSTIPLNEEEKESLGIRINVDELVASLGDWTDEKLQVQAARQSVLNIRDCLHNDLDFNQETTLSGTSIITTIKKAKLKGYTVNLNYIYVDNVSIAKQRVLKRIAKGGHGVSEELIEQRFISSFKNLKQTIPLCDKVRIYANNETLVDMVTIENNKIIFMSKQTPQFIKDLLPN